MWSAGQSCLDGFPSVTNNTCTSSSCPFQGISSSQQLRLFPSMRITCNGVLVGLSVAGESTGNNDSPILQIWRLTGSTSNDYERISEYTFPIGCTQLPNNVWQCTVSPSIDVEVGDIIGIILPRSRQSSAFRIYFTPLSSSTSYTLDSTSASTFSVPGSTTASAQPVLTLDIQEQGRSINIINRFDTVPYTDTVTETTTTELTTQAPTTELTKPTTKPTTQVSPPELTTPTEGPNTQPTHAPTQGTSICTSTYTCNWCYICSCCMALSCYDLQFHAITCAYIYNGVHLQLLCLMVVHTLHIHADSEMTLLPPPQIVLTPRPQPRPSSVTQQ